jgi:hypothetical protein
MTQVEKEMENKIQETVDLVKGVLEQTRQTGNRTASLQAARDQIRQRGEFVPKPLGPLDPVKACF